ncbi:MAG TPA: hypothetical protein VHJ76_01130, partial [Actinomycetota bacterium]|nr:hypothetical protein [Actinomycetota bacterium]
TEPRRATVATPSPDASSAPSARCRAFPDRVIDRFVEAYNARDLDALTRVVTASEVEDVVAGAYSGDSSFHGVEDWARAAWAAADRIRSAGYSFQPSSRGFEMLVTRTSNRLSQAGVERVSMTLQADTEACVIAALNSEGPVQAATDPCAFYDAFRAVADVAATEPRSCADGSAAFARSGAGAVAARGSALVWGGDRGGYLSAGDVAMDGLLLEAGSRRATRVRPPDVRPFRPEVVAWTGSELLVVGTTTKRDDVVAAAYSPATRTWRRVVFPFGRPGGFEGVWTGRELLLWGGPSHSVDPSRRGLAYDPLAREWRRTAPAPHGGRWSHAVVWTGTEMIVFGGTDSGTDLAQGLAYDPATDTWRELAPSPLSPRQWLPLVWTGTEVVAWGGSSISRPVADGAAYDPVADTWRKLRKSPLRGRHRHSAVWTGSEVVVFGGYDYHRSFANAAAYDPVANRWRRLPRAPLKPRHDHAAVWTGGQMLVFGGTWEFGHFSLGDGAWYDPATNRWRRVVPRLGDGTPSQS